MRGGKPFVFGNEGVVRSIFAVFFPILMGGFEGWLERLPAGEAPVQQEGVPAEGLGAAL